MKVQIICEHCGKLVELKPETNGKLCYVQSKLENLDIYCNTDIEISITSDIDDIKEMNDASDIEAEYNINGIEFRCRDCDNYIILNNLT